MRFRPQINCEIKRKFGKEAFHIPQILIITHEKAESLPLRQTLEEQGFSTAFAESARKAVDMLEQETKAVVFSKHFRVKEALAEHACLRLVSRVPVVVQVRPEESKRQLRDLKSQSDACFMETGKEAELARRLSGLLNHETAPEQLRLGGLWINRKEHRFTCDGTEVSLTPLEMKLLGCLMENRNLLLTGGQLAALVWGDTGYESALHTHIASLRGKIGAYRENLVSVRKMGYIFNWPESEGRTP